MPSLTGFAPSITFAENTVNATPQLLDGAVTFTDAENDFNGGTLTLSGLLAEDRASIRNQGTGAGQIGLSGTNVTYGGVVIGTLAGGSGATLTITFNASATATAIDALIQNLTYANVSNTPTASRDLVLNVTDAAGHDLIGAASPANLVQQTGGANPFGGIVGNQSNGHYLLHPTLADYDHDGDVDLITGFTSPGLLLFQNNGGVFTEVTGGANPFGNLFPVFYGYDSAPTFVNLDGDGDLDLVVGDAYGQIHLYRNDAGAYTELTGGANPFTGIDVGNAASPVFADVDGDGDLDLIVGGRGGAFPATTGTLRYYQNNGGTFTEQAGGANPFNGINVVDFSRPTFADLDADGDVDLVLGNYNLGVRTYRNNGNGTFTELTGGANPFNGVNLGTYTNPAFGDVDGDGDLDLIVGNADGTIAYFLNTATLPTHGQTITVGVTAEADAPVAAADVVSTTESATVSGNVFSNNGSGPDSDPGGAGLTVSAVNGIAGAVGNQITLPSGALLTLNADGTYSYNPNGMFQHLPGPASGAAVLTATETFTYTLAGGNTVTVTITIQGQDSTGDFLTGTAGADMLNGGIGADTLQGSAGVDTMDGGDGSDTASYSSAAGGVEARLDLGTTVNDGDGGSDTLINIENLSGSTFNDYLVGDAGANAISGGAGADVLIGREGGDFLIGGLGADSLIGEEGNDRLDGGTGAANQLQGGLGDDIYVVSALDTVFELAGQGTDEVRTTLANYALSANVENLIYTGAGAFTGAGNGLDNTITGGVGNDLLAGRGGNDTLDGGAGGSDTADYYLAAAGVTVFLDSAATTDDGDGGTDTLVSIENARGSAFADLLYGSAGANVLTGADGNDTLVGRGGNDTLSGGAGQDTADYSDATSGISINLGSGVGADGEGGTDLLISIEDVNGGTGDDTIMGSTLDNSLAGGAGRDTLVGMAGNDTLRGGAGASNQLIGGLGDDTYVVDATDTIVELAGEGTDTVLTTINHWTLAANVENLTFTGAGDFAGIGNAEANAITGGAGRDTLTGAGGNDVLDGGDGVDTVLFSGTSGQYQIEDLGGGQYRVTDTVGGRDGVDLLTDVERVRFSDGSVIVLGAMASPLIDDDFLVGKPDTGPQILPPSSLADPAFDLPALDRAGGFMLQVDPDGHVFADPHVLDVPHHDWMG